MERNRAEIHVGVGLARMVGDDRRRRHRQLADAPAIQQVGQAMIELRDQQHDPAFLGLIAQGPAHGEPVGQGCETLTHLGDRASGVGPVEHQPHEEPVGLGIVELLRLENIAAVLEQMGGDRGHDAGTVRAGQGQNVARTGHENVSRRKC